MEHRPQGGPGKLGMPHVHDEAFEQLLRQVAETPQAPAGRQEIRPGVPHVVVWPLEDYGDEGERRHWHTSCWNARKRRGPTPTRWTASNG